MATPGQTSRTVLVLLTVLAVGLLATLVWPLATSLFLAGVLAGAFHPLYERLVTRLRGRRSVAAVLITLAVLLALILPTGTLGAIGVKEAIDGVAYLRVTLQSEGVSGLVSRLPGPLHAMGEKVIQSLPEIQQRLALSGGSGAAAAAVGGILSATTQALFQTVLTLIAFFFLLTDGPRLVRWLNDIIPLGHGHFATLLNDFRRVSVAVLLSTVATAGVQTIAACLGYLIARVPNLIFFTLVTFFVAFVPAVGATSVSIFLAVLLYLTGRGIWPSVFLLAWGLGVVGLIDNIVKPLFIKGGIELHGAVVFFSLIGGLAVFGMVGLLAGPLIVAFFLAVVRMLQRDLNESEREVPAA